MKTNTASLASPAFVASVLLLLINDFVLKPRIGNAVTGKLSDFAGLFAFPFFWSALFARYRIPIYWGTAAAFILWKSSSSGPWIDAWNAVSPLQVGRVVDPGDWVALAVLPLSCWFAVNSRRVPARPWATLSIAVVSLFAFAATSYNSVVPYDQRFVFEGSKDELSVRMAEVGVEVFDAVEEWGLTIPSDFCFDNVYARVQVTEAGRETQVRLIEISHRCPHGRNEKRELLSVFQSKVAAPLGMRQR